jgi:hypothetical protein
MRGRRLVQPPTIGLGVDGRARREEKAQHAGLARAERAQQVRDAVDVGAPIGIVVDAIGRGGVGDQVDPVRDRDERRGVAQIAGERPDGSGKPDRVPAEPEDLVPVGGEEQSERGPDVAAAGDEDTSHPSTVSHRGRRVR